jgi:hypothetical protein
VRKIDRKGWSEKGEKERGNEKEKEKEIENEKE